MQQRSRKLHNEQVGVKRIKELPSGLYSKRNMDLLGRKKSSICLALKYLFQYLHPREKKMVT